jgi:hypothetical protein
LSEPHSGKLFLVPTLCANSAESVRAFSMSSEQMGDAHA